MGRLQRTLSNVSERSNTDNGRVGVVAGSIEYPNQPALVGRAALRTGSDHVRAHVTERIYDAVTGHEPNLLVTPYDGQFDEKNVDRAAEIGEWADAMVIGPGLVDAEPGAVRETLDRLEIPVVIDAIAIKPALEADLSNAVLTPNDSEEATITDAFDSIEAFTEETEAIITQTGGTDEIVADGERTVNETGTSALTVAGTGDTLAGITASLLGQGLERADAAELGAWVLGKSGELATAEYGPGVLATDVIDRIPRTIR
jgi:ADP-dependent NAD(P)H-hydrate dehydratase